MRSGPGWSARSPSGPRRSRRGRTRPSCWRTPATSERRSRRRPRRLPAPPARRPTTCSTTSPCCSARAGSASPTPRRPCVPGVAESTHNLVPVCETFIEDTETPVSAFLKLRGSGPAFLLESAEQGQRVGRWSFIGYKPRKVVRWSLANGGDPYELAEREVSRHRQAQLSGLPPFTGGAVGFFGYDCVRAVEPLGEPNPDVLGLPDLALMLTDVLVAFDHLKHTVTILANAYLEEPGAEARAR